MLIHCGLREVEGRRRAMCLRAAGTGNCCLSVMLSFLVKGIYSYVSHVIKNLYQFVI